MGEMTALRFFSTAVAILGVYQTRILTAIPSRIRYTLSQEIRISRLCLSALRGEVRESLSLDESLCGLAESSRRCVAVLDPDAPSRLNVISTVPLKLHEEDKPALIPVVDGMAAVAHAIASSYGDLISIRLPSEYRDFRHRVVLVSLALCQFRVGEEFGNFSRVSLPDTTASAIQSLCTALGPYEQHGA
jgi:hypothetical protein